jgi:hypothetical protein
LNIVQRGGSGIRAAAARDTAQSFAAAKDFASLSENIPVLTCFAVAGNLTNRYASWSNAFLQQQRSVVGSSKRKCKIQSNV